MIDPDFTDTLRNLEAALADSDARPYGPFDINAVAAKLEGGLLGRLFKTRKLAAHLLRSLWDAGNEIVNNQLVLVEGAFQIVSDENRELNRKISKTRADTRREAQRITERIELSIDDLRQINQVPYAIVLSPYQMTKLAAQRGEEIFGGGRLKDKTCAGLELFVARHIAGPLVLSREGFAGFVRQAVELDVRKA